MEIVSSDVTHMWAGRQSVRTLWINAFLSLHAVPMMANQTCFQASNSLFEEPTPSGVLKIAIFIKIL